MPMRPRLWSLSGLAVELGVNVRTLAARLKHTKSDGKVGGNPAWFMTTAMEAMQGDRPDNNVARDKIGVELELIARDLQAGLAQMRSEPSLARRRELAKSVGGKIGRLDQTLLRSLETIPEDQRPFIRLGLGRITGGAIGELLRLCDWTIAKQNAAI